MKVPPLATNKIIIFPLKEKNTLKLLIKVKMPVFESFTSPRKFKYLLKNFKIIVTNYLNVQHELVIH